MKYRCTVCGYVADGEIPNSCPQCGAPSSAFVEVAENKSTQGSAKETGTAQGINPEIVQGLQQNFTGDSTRVGAYLAMARQASQEGYPEIASMYERTAYQKAAQAAKFAELLGDITGVDTRKNLQLGAEAETSTASGKLALAKRAKELGYDAIHDSISAMAQDEASTSQEFEGALNRFFDS